MKRFRANPVFDLTLNPVPEKLKQNLDLISKSFNNSHLRNLEIMDTSEQKLYGLMTSYEGNNFCWIQPTRIKSKVTEVKYDRYIKRINRDAKLGRLHPLQDIEVGKDCVASYEADSHWYRAMIVGPSEDEHWIVLFVDYGNLQRCSPSQLAKPVFGKDCDHFHAPLQAVCCRLYNIVPRLPSLRDQIESKLESFYAEHSEDFLELIVRNTRSDYVVDCDVFLHRRGALGEARFYRRHIGQELVDAGLATFNDQKAAYAIRNETPPVECIIINEDEEQNETKPRSRSESCECIIIDGNEKKFSSSLNISSQPKKESKVKTEPVILGSMYRFADNFSDRIGNFSGLKRKLKSMEEV